MFDLFAEPVDLRNQLRSLVDDEVLPDLEPRV